MHFAKGHGTENDFVILPDPDAELDLTPDLVRRLCARRAGIGADGVLRIVEVEVLAAALTESGPGAFRAADSDGSGSDVLTAVAATALAWPAAIAEAGAPVGERRLAAQWFRDYRNAAPPELDPVLFPDGANVELVRLTGERSAQMSVYERGSGPTRTSLCGVDLPGPHPVHRPPRLMASS